MEKFIKGWDKKYSINDKGEVWSNYKYNKNGEKFYRRSLLIPTLKKDTVTVCLMVGSLKRVLSVKKLMSLCFNLIPPDKYHQYVLINKDGTLLNNQINNLGWRMHNITSWKYYPQPFYNEKGKIIKKICGHCGNKLDIKYFRLQENKGYHKTYTKACSPCIDKRTHQSFKNCPKRQAVRKIYILKYWKLSKNKERHRAIEKQQSITLEPAYIKHRLQCKGLTNSDITPLLMDVQTKSIKLSRIINNRKIK